MNDLIQEIAKQVAQELLDEMKANIVQTIKDSVIPGIDNAVQEFIDQQKAEAEASSSVWVKIRNNLLICGTVSLAWQFVQKLVVEVIEKAAESDDKTEE